jgi:hypothetical protein
MKKTTVALIILLGVYALLVTYCSQTKVLDSNPIVTVGHGAFIDATGKELAPLPDFILSTQKLYIDKMLKSASTQKEKEKYTEIEGVQKLISQYVDDKILANALFLDWLIEKVPPENPAQTAAINTALRWYYVYNLQKDPILPNDKNEWSKGIKPDAVKLLESKGIKVMLITTANSEAYCKECLEAGVPVPKAMFSSDWKFQGVIDNPFISRDLQAELWLYESKSPEGVCLALPRYKMKDGKATNEIVLLGIICLGKKTNKVCFFDNKKPLVRNVETDIKQFKGGIDLLGGDVCSDCHAGENPYVVHPDKPPFATIISKLQTTAWYNPIIPASWPQNPGPTTLLDAVSSSGQCNSCHRVGSAGRFPEVSSQLLGYCKDVLRNAVSSPPIRTMPQYGNIADYTAHINALLASCGNPPSGSGVEVEVSYPENPKLISPPLIIGPLYKCATGVAVRGAVLDAKVTLFVNGTSVGSKSPARNPDMIEFTGLSPLNVGDRVTAKQEKGGIFSADSPTEIVLDIPNPLPAPAIDPTLVYECAEIIAVRHLPGANVKVYKNGVGITGGSGSTGWTAFFTGAIRIGDKFTADISICGKTSSMSPPVIAVAAPTSIPNPRFNPATVYTGQELVNFDNLTNGTKSKVGEVTFGNLGSFTTPISWFNNFDVKTPLTRPLVAGDRLWLTQELCAAKSKTEAPPTVECDKIPPPIIQHPIVGTQFVVILQSIPGARIRVYDDAGTEIGDGSGTVIVLSRPITGTDTLTIVQQIGKCNSKKGYRVSVRNSDSSTKDNGKK